MVETSADSSLLMAIVRIIITENSPLTMKVALEIIY
jgi:hypothetical protein